MVGGLLVDDLAIVTVLVLVRPAICEDVVAAVLPEGACLPKKEYPVRPRAVAPAAATPYLINFLLDGSLGVFSFVIDAIY